MHVSRGISTFLLDQGGTDNEVVEGVLIGGDQVLVARVLSRYVGDSASNALQSRNDLVFGLPNDFVSFVELALGVCPFLYSCHVCIAHRKEREILGEGFHVGVQIPSRHYFVCWHFGSKFYQGLLHVLDIFFVWLSLGTEVSVYEYYFVNDEEGSPASPVELLVQLLSQEGLEDDVVALRFIFEGLFFGNDQSVLGSIVRGIVLVHFLNLMVKILGVLLEKHYISVDSPEIVTNFSTLPLLIQKAEVVHRLQLSYVLIGLPVLGFLQVLY